jgi:nitrogenase molybdenum-iron protein alpha/beta subunit
VGTSLGGTPLEALAHLGEARATLAIGEQMRVPAERLQARTGVPFTLLPSLTGLEPNDRLVALLTRLSGRQAPASLRRRRSQLVDAMLDGHFALTGARLGIAGDPDLLAALAPCLAGLGAEVTVAVSSTGGSPRLADLPCAEVRVGDLGDLEEGCAAAGVDLLITNGHGQPAASRLGVPLLRAGFPIVDRVGVSHRVRVGYRGTRELILEAANLLLAARDDAGHHPALRGHP